MASCENSAFVDGLLCESVTEQQMGSEILVPSISELPSCSDDKSLLDSNVDPISISDRSLGLSRNGNADAGCMSWGEIVDVDIDGLMGEHENANVSEPGNILTREWGLNRCCLTESQSNVDDSNREGGPQGEDRSAGSFGDCEIPLEVIPQTVSPGHGIQQDEQRYDNYLFSEGVREVTEEMKNDIHELVSPLQGCEIPSELADMEACGSSQQEEQGFNIISGSSFEAACEESVVLARIEADLCNRTSPKQDGGMPSEVSYACDLVSNCVWKNEEMEDNGVSGLNSLSTERTTEIVETRCNQILPSQGFTQQNDQRSDEVNGGSFVERATEYLEETSDALPDERAVIHTQILPVKANVYYSKEGSSKVAPNCVIENSVSMQSCQTFGTANNSVNGPSADSVTEVVEMESHIGAHNQIVPPEGCQRAFEGSHVSDSPSVCTQENGESNGKIIGFLSAKRVTEFEEQKSDATTNIKVEIGAQILLLEEKASNLKEGSSELAPKSIHEKSVSMQSFQPFDIVNSGSSERLDVPDKDSPAHVDSSTSFDHYGEMDHEGNDNVRVDCVSNTKCVALSSRRSGRSRKTQTKRAPRKGRNTSKVLDPLGSVEIVFKAAGRKRSCLSKPARSSIWGLLGNVTQSFEESNRLEVSQGLIQGSQKGRGGQRSGKRNPSGSSGNSRGSRGKCRASTNHVRLKVKLGKEMGKSSFYIRVPEVVDNTAYENSVEKENGIEGNWNKEATLREDKTCPDAPVLDGDLANKDLESVVLTENSAEDVIENFPGGSSHTIAVSSGGSVGTNYRDPGTSPDSEVTNLVPDADVEARPREDSNGIVLTSDKAFSASGDFISTKRGKKKHKVPHAENCVREEGISCPASINKEKPSKQDGRRQNVSQDFCPSETFTSSTCANASSNSSSDMESSLEPLRLSGETDHGISRDVHKVEIGAEAKTHCNLDVGLGLSKSQSSKTKGLKPPKGRSRGCGSASKKGNSHRLKENQKKSVNQKNAMEKAVGDQVAFKVESLPESDDHLVDGIRKANSVKDAVCIGVPNSDTVPVDLDKQYAPPRNAWVLCDDCHKWRRIPAELADVIDEIKCTWTCRDNKDKAFADCSIPQEKSNSEINAELDISDASGDEDASVTRLNYKELERRRPTVSQQNVASIKTNQFLHRNRKTQTIDEIMVCHCKPPSDGQLGCGDDCLNRMLNIECIRGACPCRDLCSNQQFQKRRYAKLEKFRCGKKGYGLRLLDDIFKGQFLIEYVGEVLDTHAYEARQKEYALKAHRHFYFMTLNGSEVIDACAKGNLGRFINHSCDPNCRTEKWMVNGEICIGLFALRDIKKGEEVTFDYNYVRVFGAAAKKCYCGSAQCRGYIGGDPLDSEVIIQDDSDEEYIEPVMIPEDGISEKVESASTNKEMDKSTIAVGELEFTTQREESVNPSESAVSHIHDSLELEHSRQKLPSSVQPVEASEHKEETSRPMSVVQQEILRENETKEKSSTSFERLEIASPIKVLSKSLSDGIDANRKSKSDTTEDRQVSSKVRPNVKTSRSSSFVKKGKVRIIPSGNKIQVAANKSHVLSIKPKRLTEGSVEEKLNELLDVDGGINKRKDSTKGYLKLLFLTAVSGDSGNGEAIQSNRDLSMILDALLKTRSRVVLIDVINKNGLRMLHNIMKKYREDFKKIPILRKLLKVLEYLAVKQILTLEHITGGPPCPGMESFMESMLSLTEHKDKQVHQIARNFRDRWIPRHLRRHGFVDRDDSKMEFNRGSNCNRLSTSHDNWRDQSGRSTDTIDSIKQSVLSTTSVSTGVQDCSAPCTGGCPTSATKVRKRKSRWDQPAETIPDSSSLQNKEQKTESGLHRPSPLSGTGEVALHLERVSGDDGNCSSSVHDNSQQNDGAQINLEDVPPGFSSYIRTPMVSSIASSSFCPLKCPAAVIGHPQEKFVSRLSVSYGFPLSMMQQYGTPHAETVGTWAVAPGIPFQPFPPLPPFPRHKKDPSPYPTVNHVSGNQPAGGQPDWCVPATSQSEESTPSTTGSNQADFGSPCANNQYSSKRVRESSNDLGRRYFKQQKYWNNTKLRTPSFSDRNGWGCTGNNSGGGTADGIGVGHVANELSTSYCSEDLSYRVEKAGNNVNQHSHHH